MNDAMSLTFDDLRDKLVFTVDELGRIERHNLKADPKELFDISGSRFSDGWGGSWYYVDFGKTWAFDALILMWPRYDNFRSDHESLIKISRALRSDDKYAVKVIRAYLNGFYGTLHGEPYIKGVTVTKIRHPNVDIYGDLTELVGMPGPDYVTYHAKDYGKTWALTEEELIRKETN